VSARPYRPSNGTEGELFIEHWCANCERDSDENCEILARTFAYDVDHPKYPKEWIVCENELFRNARCTAFVERGRPVPLPPNPDQEQLL
jgi:hypothetical protein